MRNGSPTWEKRFGPYDIALDDLTQIAVPVRKLVDELKGSIKKDGLQHPLEAHWLLEQGFWGKLRLYKGNQRYQALQEMGIKSAPCLVVVEGYDDNAGIGEVVEKIFRNSYRSTPKNTNSQPKG